MVTCGITRTFGLVTLLVASFVQCVKIHERMTDEEILDYFHTTPDKIPDYDVVTIRHNLHKRSSSHLRLQFNAFGKNIDAYLEPSDGVLAGTHTPVWLASTLPNGTVEYKRMREDIVGIVVAFFGSPVDLSTVAVIQAKNDSVSFEGMVRDIEIRSVPKRFRDPERSGLEIESSNEPLLNTHHHMIIESRALMDDDEMFIDLDREARSTRTRNETAASKSKRTTQDIVYPSLLIVTDFAQSDKTKNDFAYYDEIVYQLAYWNAVDMRFRSVEDPKIRLRIAGIIIGQDRATSPYLNKHRNGDVINMPRNFKDIDEYWTTVTSRPEFPPKAHHILVTVTDNDLTYVDADGSRSTVLGLTAMKSLCTRRPNTFCTSVVTDKGGFTGVITTTHELGHVFGLTHDRKSGDECDESHGYIMESVLHRRPEKLQWSPCSLERLSYLLRQKQINCVDEPAEFFPPGRPVKRLLPGEIADSHKQCQALGYDWACDTSPEICTSMNCYFTGWTVAMYGWWCQEVGPAAEGTPCSPGYKCLNGVCQCLTEECLFDKT